MKYCIFIKTFWRDVEWLKLCLRSIVKFCSGFDEVVVVAPKKEEKQFKGLGFTRERFVFENEPTSDGYTWQQIVKLKADTYTDADRILFVDSDCIFTTPVTPEYFLKDGKPYLLYTSYKELGGTVPWKSGTEFTIGKPVMYEFMRRHPMMYEAQTLKDFRKFIESRFGVSMEEFMLNNCHQRSLSEFNILGAYVWHFKRNVFEWFNTTDGKHPHDCLKQFWSYSGVSGKENVERLKEIVKLL